MVREEKSMRMRNLKNRKLYMQVYEEIQNYILKNNLKPGDMLPTEMDMCNTMGVSRNVLREAIKALEITGIISSKPGVGIILQEFNPDFLFQTLFYNITSDSETLLSQTLSVRRTLELGFMKEAFDAVTANEVVQLREQVAVMRRICEEKYVRSERTVVFGAEFYQADASFHKILYSRLDNVILKSIVDAVWACDRYHKTLIHAEYLQRTVEKHEKITEALAQNDYNAFSAAMYYHFDIVYKPTSIDSRLEA